MTMPVVASTWTFKDKTLFEALDIIHLLGFSDVELWAQDVHLDPRGELPDVGELASVMDRLGLTAHSIHAPFRELDLTSADPGIRRRAVTAISRVIELAADIDCPLVVVHVDGAGERARDESVSNVAGGSMTDRAAFIDRSEALERAAAALTVLCKHAQDLDVTVLIENQPDRTGQRIGARVAELLQLIDMVGASNLGICLDIAHAVVSTGGWEDELQAALPHLRSIHASDTDGSNDSHLPPGEGSIDWRHVLTALDDAGYDGGFVLEVAGGEQAVERSLDELRGREAG